ncbi:TPA: DUF433 domain-containing protein, partial [Candidatus Poribacteria bacterium]|nr:DUF433 domain-containing protein [Candidatus Poribacteria bacterium]
MNIELLERIEINTGILCGKPVIKGTRISVELILEKLASGYNFNEIVYDYDITEEDIKAAVTYTYELVANEEII